jgi:hypothetical protein
MADHSQHFFFRLPPTSLSKVDRLSTKESPLALVPSLFHTS